MNHTHRDGPYPSNGPARPGICAARVALLCIALSSLVAGCDDPAGVAGARRCADTVDCLAGQICVGGLCRLAPDQTVSDAEPDEGPDSAIDGAPDSEPDRAVDAAPDMLADIGLDVGLDLGLDLGLDASLDVGLDFGLDTGPDTGPDLGPDGQVDAGPDLGPMVCEPGTVRACGVPFGRCNVGLQTCDARGQWGPCDGGAEPAEEICNGLDDDCDGRTDEALAEVCGDGGDCRPGRRVCELGVWTACDDAQDPRAEVCDGFDDDCDGAVDEDLLRPCSFDRGQCSAGLQTCVEGVWQPCEGGTVAAPETCDGTDEDCDGLVDEELFIPCGGDPCDMAGIRLCLDGAFGDCLPRRPPISEACDNRDNDCDGMVDEGVLVSCGEVVGACRAGTSICRDGVFGECLGGIAPIDELCNDIDDDCDGAIDEGVAPLSCGEDEGLCVAGARTCLDGAFGPCIGEVGPAPERCDYEDNDCDGRTDERLPTRPEICNQLDDDCDGTTDEDVPVSPEVCNAVDDDCDGQTDEGTEARPEICDGLDNDCDIRVDEDVVPIPELCNGIDDDCDGRTDEDARPILCGTNIGECRAGIRRCIDGAPTEECDGSVDPVAEVCDGLDNDCDGRADEQVAGDRDDDGIGDCLEEILGLDPDDPRDAELDYDHDGRNNRDEALQETPLWSTLFLIPAEPPPMADPALIFVSLQLYQPDIALQPELIEAFIHFDSPALEWNDVTLGQAAFDADKEVFPNIAGEGYLRVVLLSGFNINPIGSGELALISFRRDSVDPVNLRIDRVDSRFAPQEADDALDIGIIEHRVPLTIP